MKLPSVMLAPALVLAGLPAAAKSDTPYAPIVTRNAFALTAVPVHAAEPPITLPPIITPNGIMNLLGKRQVMFKVHQPAVAGPTEKDVSCILSEGERQGEIEVQKIDLSAGTITFNNHGVIQTLALVRTSTAPRDPR